MRQFSDNRCLIAAVVFAAVFAIITATSAQATIVAKWSFEADNFLGDSSGNGNTLANFGATPTVDATSGAPGTGVATFNGTSNWMSTLGSLDLSPYDDLRVSWYQKLNTTEYCNAWEHSSSFIGNPGAIVADLNDGPVGGKAGVWGANPAGSSSNYNLDDYTHATNNTWEQLSVEFRLNSPTGTNVTKVYRNGSLVSSGTAAITTNLAPFINDTFFIGTRGGTEGFLKGSIDELVIETGLPPEPPPAVIAKWSFEPDNPATPENEFLLDSSGNGNTLSNIGVVSQTDPMAGFMSRNSASFDGTSHMQTALPLDLSDHSRIRLSWWQKVADGTTGIVWEHSPTFIGTPGAIVADVNDGGVGNGKAGVWGVPGDPAYNLNNYAHSTDNTWEHMAVEFNLGASSGEDVTRVFRNGNLTGTATAADTTKMMPFLNDTFFIGARGGTSANFYGNIDELTIESLPPLASIPDAPNDIPPIANESLKLYIMAGQSNAMGQYAPSSELPVALQGEQADVVIYSENPSTPGEWETLKPGILTATPQDFGPEITFGRAMADGAAADESIVLLKYAVGATTLANDWNSTNPGPLYTGMVDAVLQAVADLTDNGHTVEIAGMTWMQGESDALVGTYAAAYEANFENFVDDLRADLGDADLPIAIAQIASDPVWVYYNAVHTAVDNVVANNTNLAAFSTDALSTYSHHYDAQGQQDLGNLFASALNGMRAAASIPEPGTAAMLLMGGLSLAFFRGRERNRGLRLLLIACVVLSVSVLQGPMAHAEIVAQWRFEPDDPDTTTENEFLMDSSGNGNTLSNFGVVSETDNGAGFPGLGGAAFDGSSHFQTASTLDLSPYRQLLVTWWQKVADNTSTIAWEHSETFIGTPGSIVADVNDGGNGNGKAGVWGANPAMSAANFNLDNYPHSYNNTWEHIAVEIDLDASYGSDVVTVFRNGNPVGTPTSAQTANTVPFLDDIFYIGARGGNSLFFKGGIDELTIQGFPDVVVERLPGDANEDKAVNVTDLGILATNYGVTSGMEWGDGDFTGDHAVNVSDLGILATHYGESIAVASVPEPATTAMLLAAIVSMAITRRRKN